jgi:Endomembrane protein 70
MYRVCSSDLSRSIILTCISFKRLKQLSRKVDITNVEDTIEVKYSYSVEWYEETLEWKDRHQRYTESRFLPASFEIHWLSIINSFVLVLLLTAFLTIIMLRVLKNDFSRYMELDDEAMEEEEVRQAMMDCSL